jgi:hypothetical protein
MTTQVQLRGGTSASHAAFTGASREVTVNTDANTLVVHDGTTPGGHPVVSSAGSYANPSWITSLAWSKITDVPSTFTPSAHTHPASSISDSTVGGRALLTAASAAAQRSLIYPDSDMALFQEFIA